MPVYDKYNFLLLPKMLVLNPKDGIALFLRNALKYKFASFDGIDA